VLWYSYARRGSALLINDRTRCRGKVATIGSENIVNHLPRLTSRLQLRDGDVASNDFGIVGRIVGIVASSRNLAAGIGSCAAALSFYDRWVARGHDVVFRKDTRIEVTTSPGRNFFHAAEVQQPLAIDR